MNDLPAGFELDDDLPPGFELDGPDTRNQANIANKESSNDPMTQQEYDQDVSQSVLSGLFRKGPEMLLGFPGDVESLAGMGVDYLSEKMGSDYRYPRILPNTDDIRWATGHLFGPAYEPKTNMGAALGFGAEMVPGLLFGGGGAAGKANNVAKTIEGVGPVASDTAKGVVGAVERSRQEANALWDQARSVGAQYDMEAYKKTIGNINMKLKSDSVSKHTAPTATKFAKSLAPKAKDVAEDVANAKLKSLSPEGVVGTTFQKLVNGVSKPMDFDELDAIRREAGELVRDYTKSETERRAAGIIRDELDKFELTTPIINSAAIPAKDFAALVKEARSKSLINIKARTLQDAIESAKTYQSGFESGLRNQFSNLLRSKKGSKLFNDVEKAAIQEAAKGNFTTNVLRTLGRFGVDFSNLGNTAALLPGGLLGGSALAGNPLMGAALTAGATGAKYAGRKLTERAADRAMQTVLAGSDNLKRAATLDDAVREQMRLARLQRGFSSAPGALELDRRYRQ